MTSNKKSITLHDLGVDGAPEINWELYDRAVKNGYTSLEALGLAARTPEPPPRAALTPKTTATPTPPPRPKAVPVAAPLATKSSQLTKKGSQPKHPRAQRWLDTVLGFLVIWMTMLAGIGALWLMTQH